MAFYTKDPVRKQTIWGQHGPDKEWHAFIDADVTDEAVIENAKRIVDACSPQRYGPHGTQAYSFLKREYDRLCAKYGHEVVAKVFGEDDGDRLIEIVEGLLLADGKPVQAGPRDKASKDFELEAADTAVAVVSSKRKMAIEK